MTRFVLGLSALSFIFFWLVHSASHGIGAEVLVPGWVLWFALLAWLHE